MNYVDCHVHIDFYDNFDVILDEYETSRTYAIFVTNLPELYQKHYLKIRRYKYVRLALGFHPQLVSQYDFNRRLFDYHLPDTNYIGEIGLDASSKNIDIDKQLEVFHYILTQSRNKGKVLSVHSKGTEVEVLDLLEEHQAQHVIFHWYSGSLDHLTDIIDAGYYLSVNPRMLQTEKGKKILRRIPEDRILFETDGPFVKLNKTLITPSLIPQAYKNIGDFLGLPDLRTIIYRNFQRLIINAYQLRLELTDIPKQDPIHS